MSSDPKSGRALRANRLALPVLSLALAGCAAVGPDWHAPAAPVPAAAARGAFLRAGSDGAATPAPAQWWTTLGDPVLDAIEARALAGSPDLAAARARIAAARATLAQTRAAFTPSLSIGASVGDVSLPGTLVGGGRVDERVYADNFDASWELDLFGGTRRKVEAARDRADAIAANADDLAVSLSAEIARDYADLRGQQAIARQMQRTIAIDRALLAAAEDRATHGTGAQTAVEAARATLAQAEADLADARAQITVLGDTLAVLAGGEPGTLDAVLATEHDVPLPPDRVALGDPVTLLRHRPDIRAAEAQWAAANADLGAAIAARYPRVSFTGLLGMGGTRPGDAFDPSTLFALVLPQISWSAFDGGRAAAAQRNAAALRDANEAAWRAAVLAGLRDTETALTRFGAARIAFARAGEARHAAERQAALQQARAEGGTLSRADALIAERAALAAGIAEQRQRAALASAYVAVNKALGLGWQAAQAQK